MSCVQCSARLIQRLTQAHHTEAERGNPVGMLLGFRGLRVFVVYLEKREHREEIS